MRALWRHIFMSHQQIESRIISLSFCSLPLSVPDRGFLLCTLINTTIKYTPPTLGPPTWRGQLMWLTHMQIVHCQRCHIWFTVAIYTHLPSLGDAMAWPAGVNQGKRGGGWNTTAVHVSTTTHDAAWTVCLFDVVNWFSKSTYWAVALCSPQHASTVCPSTQLPPASAPLGWICFRFYSTHTLGD